ncbi:MAG: SIR2 family protein [Syntrophothermus sp.]
MDNPELSVDTLGDLMPFIDDGTVIPIISNSFRLEEIFRDDEELKARMAEMPEFYDELRTIDQQLTKQWAKKIGYPMSDDHNLARVAQYRQVESGDQELAKIEYLKFLSEQLIKISEKRQGYEAKASQLRTQLQRLIFSDIVQQLDYPNFTNGVEDPLRLLARLPLPIYVTTSYSNFLERALELENKHPRTQICFWNGGKANIKPEHLPDPNFDPTSESPAVYHLFGLENYRKTLVLSEDDYINFLMNAVEEINSQDLYPTPLRLNLPDARLILLGYNLHDWDFRALFRFILRIRKTATARESRSTVIQFKPNLEKKDYETKLLRYLERYFEDNKFRVRWSRAEDFVCDLWKAWENYRQGLS